MAKVRTDTIRFITDVFFDGEFFSSINAEEGGYITLGDDLLSFVRMIKRLLSGV